MKPERKAKNLKVSKKKGNSTLIIVVVALILLAGIAYAVLSKDPASDNGKAQKTLKEFRAQIEAEYGKRGGSGTNTPPVTDDYTPILSPRKADKLPDYVYTNAMTLKAYKYATEYPEILEQMPCYCGCEQHGSEASDGRPHRFLRDCFINDRGMYDGHAATCDVCIGIAIKSQSNFPSGILKLSTSTAGQIPLTQPVDLSALSLPDNFKSLSDGLKLIPPGITWVYFANLRQGTGIEQKFMHDTNFYGSPVIGMLNSEYSDGSWVELHDIGKTSANVRSNAGENVDNILYTRPYIFDTKDKTSSVLALFKDSSANASAYDSFKSVLEKVDDENAGFARISTDAPAFADMSYFGLVKTGDDVTGEIAFRIKDNGSVPLTKYNELRDSSANRGFKSYEVQKENNTLIIKMTSSLDNVISEATKNYEIDID